MNVNSEHATRLPETDMNPTLLLKLFIKSI